MGLEEMKYDTGQTPLDPDEMDGLLIATVLTRGDLDEVEQRNIEEAIRWTIERRKHFSEEEILTEQFVMLLHTKMYGGVWEWAGRFRNTNKNIGVDKFQISAELKALLDDCRYWIKNNSFPEDEIAIRLKHRIVSIHCFPNGNGRHSRLLADLVAEKIFGKPVFTWGSKSLIRSDDLRSAYLDALRKADKGFIESLVSFARS